MRWMIAHPEKKWQMGVMAQLIPTTKEDSRLAIQAIFQPCGHFNAWGRTDFTNETTSVGTTIHDAYDDRVKYTAEFVTGYRKMAKHGYNGGRFWMHHALSFEQSAATNVTLSNTLGKFGHVISSAGVIAQHQIDANWGLKCY